MSPMRPGEPPGRSAGRKSTKKGSFYGGSLGEAGRQDGTAALTEADAAEAVAAAGSAQDDGVAVLQEGPLLAAGELQWLRAAAAELEQRTAFFRASAGQCARTEEVAVAQGAAV